jgi:disulfide bond formation protein DsbB
VVHWWILGLALVLFALLRFRPDMARLAAGALFIGFAVSVYFAGRHVGVEHHWIPAQCETAKFDPNSLRFDVHATVTMPRCDVPAWSMFGITMAGYNALISLVMALASLIIALTPSRKEPHG